MNDTQQIKDKLDIVDFIGEYVQLKAAGINHKGLCPFHSEKSPSFMANRDRQSWHCFGCNKGGDIFSFVQEIEGMEFVEALKFLADKAGVQLEVRQKNPVAASQKNRLKEIITDAARFYHNFLLKIEGSQSARDYLQARGILPETIEHWQIGYIAEQWDLLTQYLLKKGHSIDDLVAAGLTIKKDGARAGSSRGFYDRFRGRIMFPIRDVHGNVCGFTGRVLVETEKSGGKYVNSPQTMIYDKSRIIFGLDFAKKETREKDFIVLVEGQTDVISSHQAGITNVVATSGTALTEEQIKLIKRYTKNVRMAFDSDAAGVKAAKRGIDLALEAGLSVKVIQVPGGKDPDECIKQDVQMWKDAIENAEEVMDWYFARVLEGKDLKNPHDKQAIADALLIEIARIPFAVERDHWLQQLAGTIGTDVSVLRQDISRVTDTKSPRRVEEAPVHAIEKKPKTRIDLLAERYIALLCKFNNVIGQEIKDTVIMNAFRSTQSAPLYEIIKNNYTTSGSFTSAVFSDFSDTNMVNGLLMKADAEFSDFSDADAKKEADTLLSQIKNIWKKERGKEIEQELVAAHTAQDKQKELLLLEEFQALQG